MNYTIDVHNDDTRITQAICEAIQNNPDHRQDVLALYHEEQGLRTTARLVHELWVGHAMAEGLNVVFENLLLNSLEQVNWLSIVEIISTPIR